MTYKLAIVGDYFSEEEAKWGKPFIGTAGEALNSLLADAGILREECFLTTVFAQRPPGGDLSLLCGGLREPGVAPGLSSLSKGKYLKSEFLPELTRLHRELEEVSANLTVLLGNTACWAVLGTQAISKIRGTICSSPRHASLKILPTYHPRDILRQYEHRHVTVLDLLKAKKEMEFPELIRPTREIWMDPDREDLEKFYRDFIAPAEYLSCDVETAFQQITCIGFAPSIDRAIVVPFLDYRYPGGHYWKTLEDEVFAWEWVQRCLLSGARVLGQNFQYDMQYLWRRYGIIAPNWTDDTMILHHSLQPESPKSLGFLGSVYTNEIAWKPQRPKSKHNEKAGDSE